jgi:hypothetical protein
VQAREPRGWGIFLWIWVWFIGLQCGISASNHKVPCSIDKFEQQISGIVSGVSPADKFPGAKSFTLDGKPISSALQAICASYRYVCNSQEIAPIKKDHSGKLTWYGEEINPALLNGWFLTNFFNLAKRYPNGDIDTFIQRIHYGSYGRQDSVLPAVQLDAAVNDGEKYIRALQLCELLGIQALRDIIVKPKVNTANIENPQNHEINTPQLLCKNNPLLEVAITNEIKADREVQGFLLDLPKHPNDTDIRNYPDSEIMERLYYLTPSQKIVKFRSEPTPQQKDTFQQLVLILLSLPVLCEQLLALDRFHVPPNQEKPIPECENYPTRYDDIAVVAYFSEVLRLIALGQAVPFNSSYNWPQISEAVQNLTALYQLKYFTTFPKLEGVDPNKLKLLNQCVAPPTLTLPHRLGDLCFLQNKGKAEKPDYVTSENIELAINSQNVYNHAKIGVSLSPQQRRNFGETKRLPMYIAKQWGGWVTNNCVRYLSQKLNDLLHWIEYPRDNNANLLSTKKHVCLLSDFYANLRFLLTEANFIDLKDNDNIFIDQPYTYEVKCIRADDKVFCKNDRDLSANCWFLYKNGEVSQKSVDEITQMIKDRPYTLLYERRDQGIERRCKNLAKLFRNNRDEKYEKHLLCPFGIANGLCHG